MTSTGTTAFLRQAHRNNWEQYLATLRPGAQPGWDICVLTASDERQAEMYRCQLNWRREAGLLPAGMSFLVLPDPGGRRIGSGGATLNALAQVAGLAAEAEGGRLDALQRVLLIHSGGDSKRLPHCSATGKLFARVPRVLPDGRASSIFDEFLIGLSGLATQLPPGVLIASGDVLLIFDHLQLRGAFRRPGVIGVAAATPAEMGLDHGVYVSGDGGHRVAAYLHKPSVAELDRWGGIGADGTVQIDTGLVWLDASVAQTLVGLTRDETVVRAPLNLYGDLLLPLAGSTTLESYLADESDGPATPAAQAARRVLWERLRGTPFTVERLQPAVFVHFGTSREYWQMTAGDPELADLCGWTPSAAAWDTAVGSPAVLINSLVEHPIPAGGPGESRPLIVDSDLRGAISRLDLHSENDFGSVLSGTESPRGLGGAVQSEDAAPRTGRSASFDSGLHRTCGHRRWAQVSPSAQDASLGHFDATRWPKGHDNPIQGASTANSDYTVPGPGAAIISGVQTSEPLRIGPDMVIDQMPVAEGRFVTRIFGLLDDPKRAWDAPGATFLNRPWAEWLAAAGIAAGSAPELLWPHAAVGSRSLWNALLYPVLPERDASLRLALPLQDPAAAPDGWLAAWLAAPRLSLAESAAQADGPRLLAELADLEDAIAARRFCAAVEAEEPAAAAKTLLGAVPAAVARRSRLAIESIMAADPILQLRGFKALAEVTGERAWEDRAFSTLAKMIENATLKVEGSRFKVTGHDLPPSIFHLAPSTLHLEPSTLHLQPVPVRVRAAARIDLGGGWTDTPPYSIERGGTVLNAAITLRGSHPIEVEAARLPEPRLILENRDVDSIHEPQSAAEVLAYARPGDPFSLHKAALVLRGVVPADADPKLPLAELLADRGGLRLSTGTTIPFGSGLGTSSILAGAVLAALAALQDQVQGATMQSARLKVEGSRPSTFYLAPSTLFDEVLCLEQMLTTGGGWQDQVGGLTGGVKLVTTPPGLPQRITVTPVEMAPAVAEAFDRRLVLVYTGQQRLAKNLLRTVMGRWMARDPEMVWIQAEIARLAVAMRDALLAGDLDGFGALLAEHWTLNKRMDPGCTNPFIDELFETMRPYVCGGKLAGAGGGGFVSAMARDPEAPAALAVALTARYPGTPVAVWPCAVPTDGLKMHTVEGAR